MIDALGRTNIYNVNIVKAHPFSTPTLTRLSLQTLRVESGGEHMHTNLLKRGGCQVVQLRGDGDVKRPIHNSNELGLRSISEGC